MKHALQSKTIWAGLAQLVIGVILFVTSHSSPDKYFACSVFVTGMTTIYGRIKADKKVTWRVK